MLAITFTSVVIALHVMAVVAAFGVLFVYPVLLPWLQRTQPGAMPAVHDALVRVHRMVVTPAMVIVLLAGIYLASDEDVWSESWVSIALVIILVLFGVVHGFLVPQHRQLARAGVGGADYEARFSRLVAAAGAAGVLVLVAIFFMVVKP
jgi:uncharacterized membrane protein